MKGGSKPGGERLENKLAFTYINLYICIYMFRYTHRHINIYVWGFLYTYTHTYMHTPASCSRTLLLERRMSCPFLEVFKFD